MNDMKRFRLPMASVLLAVWVATVGATEGLAPMPVAVAESEAFEAVGRLSDEGLVWFIDRADSNAPVLDARLEVEAIAEASSRFIERRTGRPAARACAAANP